eukprot:scpid58640/ scgid1714/ 
MNVITAFLVSLLAIPVMRVFNNLDLMSDHRAIFISAAAVLAFIALIVYVNKLLTAHDKNPVNDKFVYVFVVFAFTSIVDLFIGLELHGFVEEYMAFYFKETGASIHRPLLGWVYHEQYASTVTGWINRKVWS